MSWVDKAHRKHKVDKLVREVLSNPEYKKNAATGRFKMLLLSGINLRGFHDEKTWIREEENQRISRISGKVHGIRHGR